MEVIGSTTNQPEVIGFNAWQPPAIKSAYVSAVQQEDEELKGIMVDEIKVETLPEAVSRMQAEGVEPTTAAQALADIRDKGVMLDQLTAKGSHLSYEDLEASADPNVSAAYFKRQMRMQEAADRLTNIIASNEDNFVDTINNFLYDALVEPVRDMPTALSMGGGQFTASSDTWATALNMSDKDWEQFLNDHENQLRNPGFLDGASSVASMASKSLMGLEAEGYAKDDELMSFFNSALSLGDVFGAGIAAKGLAVGGKRVASNIGKSVITRVASARGTNAATKVAVAMTKGGAKNASVASSIMPTAFQVPSPIPAFKAPRQPLRGSTAMSVAETPTAPRLYTPPPVSQAAIRQVSLKNRFISMFAKMENVGSFGKAGWQDDVATWTASKVGAIAQAAGGNVINIGTVEDGLVGSFKSEITYGDISGGTIKSYNAAVKLSQKIPNSVIINAGTGAKVTTGIKGVEYVIKSELPVDIMTAAPKQLSESRGLINTSGWVTNWFGSANLGIQDDLNSLAFQADAGAGKILNFIQDTIKDFSRLNGEDQEALSTIFRTLSDSKRTTWLDQKEFISEYQAITGKMPQREVIQVYELTVEASDAAYFFKASEHLRAMNSKNTLMFDAKGKGVWEQVYPDTSARATIGKVRNAKTGDNVDATSLPDDVVIYKYVEGTQGKVRHFYNVQGMTRLPTISDALPYNAGGPRSNPHLTYFVGTVNDMNTATGKGSSWGTIIGAKSEKDSIAAVKEINAIQKASDVFKSKGLDIDPANPYRGLSATEAQALDDLVIANNSWMPQITDWKSYVEFLDGRGVRIGEPVVWKPRNASLLEFIDYQNNSDFLIRKNLDSYIEYKRHDLSLMEYGGNQSWNPNPVQSILRQLNQSVSYAAHTQWRVEHTGRFMKLIDKYKDWKGTGEVLQLKGLGPFTPEVQIRHLEIVGNSAIAKQLRREQSVIIRRMNAYEGSTSENQIFGTVRGAWTAQTDKMLEAIHNGTEWDFVKDKMVPGLRNVRDNISGTLMSIGFMTKMTSPSTFVVQAAAAYQIAAVTPRNAMKAASLAMYVRKIAANRNGPLLLNGFRGNLAKLSGLNTQQMDNLIDHFTNSGRGFARGAVVDDPEALPGVAKGLLGKAGDVARIPYYAGENFAQTVSRIAAYLDTIDRFPSAPLDSKQFWEAVATRDRALSLSMNKSSSSMLQTDGITRFFTQFAHFNFRAIETVFFDKALTVAERARLAASMTVLWGWAGMGLADYISEPDGASQNTALQLAKYGPIDYLLNEAAGVTIGGRLGLNIPQLLSRAAILESPAESSIPGVSIAATATGHAMSSMYNFVNGRGELGFHDLGRLVRTWKTVDDAYMAYTMAMSDVRTSVTGSSLPANYSNFEVLFQALGFKPEKLNELYRLNQKGYKLRDRQKAASKAALPSMKLAADAAEAGDWSRAAELTEDAAAILDAYNLPPTVRNSVVKQIISDAGEDRIEAMVMSCIKAGCSQDALNFVESLK